MFKLLTNVLRIEAVRRYTTNHPCKIVVVVAYKGIQKQNSINKQ